MKTTLSYNKGHLVAKSIDTSAFQARTLKAGRKDNLAQLIDGYRSPACAVMGKAA